MEIQRKRNLKSKAYSFIELIIALTLFAVVASIAISVMSNVLRSSKKIEAQAFLYTEGQNLMDQLSLSVAGHAVDYEAYYAREVLEEGWETPNYGYYGQAFFSPGSGGPSDSEDGPYETGGYGVACPSDDTKNWPLDCPSEQPLANQFDQNLGLHPIPGTSASYSQSDEPEFANAFCTQKGGLNCADLEHHLVNELLLIDEDGDERLVFAPIVSAEGTRMGKLVLVGVDNNSDGMEETWSCLSLYECADPDSPDEDDLKAISPSALEIQDFWIAVTPTEDPYRAFSEDVQIQPMVTIFLTLTLGDSYDDGRLGENKPVIHLERTVSTGVYQVIPSYK